MSRRFWWIGIVALATVGAVGFAYIGVETYRTAPPLPSFTDATGRVVIPRASILRGQALFQQHALMNYGSIFGDGAGRGPDFTADALHETARLMRETYLAGSQSPDVAAVATARMQAELKRNTFDAGANTVTLSDGQAAAARSLPAHYATMFSRATTTGDAAAAAGVVISDPAEIDALSSFFFWSAWVAAVNRPGVDYSYTHNWPYDPSAGNTPSGPVTLWSVLGLFTLVLGLGAVMFMRGRFELRMQKADGDDARPLCTTRITDAYTPTPTQRATYKFFAVAAVLFLLQVTAGLMTIHGFVNYTGIDLAALVPITVSRSWHLQLALLWISTCWIAASIFALPMMAGGEPRRQRTLVNGLFALLCIVVVGMLAGVYLGPTGALGDQWRLFGNQGWEFVELGRAFQWVLFVALALWGVIVLRGVLPFLRSRDKWALPNWLFYTIACVVVLFVSGFIATPETNFAIADFWRWSVIHMWVEAFLEVFTTVVVAYHMYLMGLVSWRSASAVVYAATILFLGSGMLGIAHNFYWNAKPVPTLAIGSVFSTLQVVPLMMLTLDAWRLRHMPADARAGAGLRESETFAHPVAFLFLMGVSFWNFFGAGVLGLIINLPIVNYFEHGTYLTVNHGHAAFMGVYGNLSLAGMLFCVRYLVKPSAWVNRALMGAFWSLNAGLMLMVMLDLFPVGVLQLQAVLDHGLAYARSSAFIESPQFRALTWLRGIGVVLFITGGVIPISWFMVTRWSRRRSAAEVGPPPRVVEIHGGAAPVVGTESYAEVAAD
jgi:nitric oxide reductase subunit B